MLEKSINYQIYCHDNRNFSLCNQRQDKKEGLNKIFQRQINNKGYKGMKN